MSVPIPAHWVGHGLTADDPREIRSTDDWIAINQYPDKEDTNWGIGSNDSKFYKVMNDLDFGNAEIYPIHAGIAAGGLGNAVTVTIDGNYKTITRVKVLPLFDAANASSQSYSALIARGSATNISNLHVMDSTFEALTSTTAYNFAAVFCGYGGAQTECSGTNNTVTASNATTSNYAGGVCAYQGTQTGCTSENNTVTASNASYASYAGGVCGYAGAQTECSCTNNAVSAANGSYVNYAGGVCGFQGTQTGCEVRGGSVSATSNASAYVRAAGISGQATISSCFASCAIIAKTGSTDRLHCLAGGITYYQSGTYVPTTNSFSACTFDVSPFNYVANIEARNATSIDLRHDNFADTEYSGITTPETGMTALTTAQAQSASGAVLGLNNGLTPPVWKFAAGQYPYLLVCKLQSAGAPVLNVMSMGAEAQRVYSRGKLVWER